MINKLSLGTANFNNNYGLEKNNLEFSNKHIKQILYYSHTSGINNIDTASNYTGVEKKLSVFNISKFKVSSKLPAIPVDCKNIEKFIFKKIYNSIKYLKISSLENYFIHNPKDLTTSKFKKKIYLSLVHAKRKKLIKRIGVSVYSLKELRKIIKNYKIDVVQLPLSLFDRRFLKIIHKLKKKKIIVQARSIFLQGLLLREIKNIPKNFSKFKEFKKFDNWINKNNISRLEACVNFLKSNSYIDSYVVGFNNLSQFKEIIELFKVKKKIFFPKIFSKNLKLIDPRKW